MKRIIPGALILLVLMVSLAAVLYGRERHAGSPAMDSAEMVTKEPEKVPDEQENSPPGMKPAEMEQTVNPEPTPEIQEATPPPQPLREISLSDTGLPEELLLPASHCGTVEEKDYETRDMVSDLPYKIRKNVTVYLPWGYDPGEQYDVLILLHCAWTDQRFWLEQDRNYGTEAEPIPVSVPNLLDRMIEEGYCRPLIVISPCIYLYDGQPSSAGNAYDYAQFAKEFGADFLSWAAENYATYAADGSRDALREAREHFGVLGASFGAYASYISLIRDNFDLAAWYTFCGGGEIDPGYLTTSWTERGTAELPLRMIYICEGEYDDRAGPELSYYNLLNTGGAFGKENVMFTLVNGWGHEDHSYLVGLYNTLQMFFRAD